MKLYNTLSRQVEDFQPIEGNRVKLYSCGPTVYDYAHLGNLRAYVFDDTLRRALEANDYEVKHVMNITDVGHLDSDADEGDDKLEKGAKRENKTVWEVAEHFTNAFKHDMSLMNNLPPNGYQGPKDNYARATDFIKEQQEIVQILLDKTFAYQTEQAIYFDVTKLPSYGELTGQKLADKEVAARSEVVTDANKHHPHDFALWFFAVGHFAGHSMRWPSPWGEGFPGWHLECSAIIHAILGDPIDIHTGGVDHIGTHHTNEMAQTEAAFGHKLSNFWLHNEHMLVDGQKMSKSLGNFFTLDDVIKRGFDPLALRLLFLQSHYRSQTNFTWEALEAAQNALHDLYAWADLSKQAGSDLDWAKLLEAVKETVAADLNTPKALAAISEVTAQKPSQESLGQLDDILGLKLADRPDISEAQKKLIDERETARRSQDWAKADQIRTQLIDDGIEINDTADGPIWSRKKI